MNAYVDSSVVLRIVLSEPKRLRAWSRITTPVASELIRLECLRTIDRARLRLSLKDKHVAVLRSQVLELVESFNLVALEDVVLERRFQRCLDHWMRSIWRAQCSLVKSSMISSSQLTTMSSRSQRGHSGLTSMEVQRLSSCNAGGSVRHLNTCPAGRRMASLV